MLIKTQSSLCVVSFEKMHSIYIEENDNKIFINAKSEVCNAKILLVFNILRKNWQKNVLIFVQINTLFSFKILTKITSLL